MRDVYALPLCGSKGKRAKRTSNRYRYKGKCRSFTSFNAGKLGDKELKFKKSVHGAVIGTATVKGKAYAFARKRSTFGRDALNLAALKDMTEGKGTTPASFYKSANQFGFTFNWGYINRTTTANFSSGLLPVRPKGLDRRLPTLGTGKYEWKGYLKQNQHPHETGGPEGAAAELEQPLGTGLHARRRRALRLGPARRAVRQGAGQGHAGQHGRHHEPGGHRGRPLARMAVHQQGAGVGQGAQRPCRPGQDDPGRLGGA